MNPDADKLIVRARSSVLVRTALFVAALLILTTLLMSWAGYVVARGIIKDQIDERLRVASADRHAMVLSFVAQQHERAGLVASRTKLRNLVAQFEHGEIDEQTMRDGTRPILEDARSSTEGFRAIWIADPQGKVITSTDDKHLSNSVSDDPAYQAGLAGKHLGEPVSGDDGRVTTIACPARTNDGELLGVVMVELDVARLFKILSDTEGLGKTGEILVGTRDGSQVRYLFQPRDGSDRTAPLDEVPAMAAAIGGATGSEVTEYNGLEVLVHFRPIEYQPMQHRPWGLVAKMSAAEAYAPLDDFQRARLWVQIGLLIIGLAGSFWLSRRLTRPIRDLTETATAVAGGDLTAQVNVTTDDEIGVLGRTFNVMTRQLQSSYATLEDRVRQRTAELSSEIARREAVQQEVQQNAERIQRIIDTANDAFISMDAAGLIVEWNPQAQAMFGWTRDEVLQRPVADTLIPESSREGHSRGLERFLKTREAHVLNRRLELTALRRDGTEFPVGLTITPQRLGDEFVFNAFLHDITQRKEDEQTLRDARESAEAANRSKSEFLANMSHEIRTPMNGIIGMSELLASTQLKPEQRGYLKMVKQSAEALLGLLNDILDFSKIEAGKLELENIPFSLRDCVGNVGHTLSSRASEKGIELACRVAPEIPDILIGDPGRLRQVIVNLAGNAIKFTEQGEVVIDVVPVPNGSAARVDEAARSEEAEDGSAPPTDSTGKAVMKVMVRDTGIGIPPEKQKVIFDAFGQADASTTRQYGGTGLGLAISTQLVELMQGQIHVESEVGQGTTFSFTAEFGIAAEQTLRQPVDLDALRGMSVLVVDDNETNRLIMHEMLESWNMHPLTAESGTAALELMQQRRANGESVPLVLLDYMMPGMDGFEFARNLRESVSADECTMIMVSSAIQPDDTARCRELSIARCMPKPVMHSELLNTILAEVCPETRFSAESSEPEMPADVAPRRILLAEDGLVNQRVAIGFLQKHGHQVVVVEDGQQAVDAVAREPFDLVLMDVQMPIIDGFAATAAIRRSEAGTGRHMPIIAMTANAMKGDRERCLEAGMDDYVAKPMQSAELYRAVESVPARVLTGDGDEPETEHGRLAESTEVTKAEAAAASVPAASAPEQPSRVTTPTQSTDTDRLIDWGATLRRLPGGESLVRELAEMLMTEAPMHVEQMRAAQDAGDFDSLRRAAHTLKGSVSIFEVSALVALSEQMEAHATDNDLEAAGRLLPVLQSSVARLADELSLYLKDSST